MIDARDRVAPRAGPTPVLLKIAPDLTLADLDDVVGVARARNVDGMIVGNTTIGAAADAARSSDGARGGRAVGPAAVPLSTRMLAETYVRAEGAFPLIGVGGIDSGAAALAKIRAGATCPALQRAGLPRARPGRRDQGRTARGALERGDAQQARPIWSAPMRPR